MAKKRTTRKRLNQVEKFYIKGNADTLEAEEIAKHLHLPLALVQPVYDNALEALELESEEGEFDTAGEAMNNEPERGYVTSTKASSELGDAQSEQFRARRKETAVQDTDHIHRIKR